METSIELRGLPPVLLSELDERAKKEGLDREAYVLRLIEQDLHGGNASFDEILGPIRGDLAARGMSEQEIEAFVQAEVAAARLERRERIGRK